MQFSMRKDEFLSSPNVMGFISWIEPLLDTPQSLSHTYIKKKGKRKYEFDNLYSAYKQYDWPPSIDAFSADLAKGIATSNESICESACHRILEWGGVTRGNKERVSRLKPDLCAYLRNVRDRMTMDLPSTEYFTKTIQMTSGFSKIYSAYIDDYMIYDSRVGAALGLLVRNYCESNGFPSVPKELSFIWIKGLEGQSASLTFNRRNPSRDSYVFPQLLNNPKIYFENNIRANWLMSTVAKTTRSKFGTVEQSNSLTALEQSLFMIGYDVSDL